MDLNIAKRLKIHENISRIHGKYLKMYGEMKSHIFGKQKGKFGAEVEETTLNLNSIILVFWMCWGEMIERMETMYFTKFYEIFCWQCYF